jgi:hypothetical protein
LDTATALAAPMPILTGMLLVAGGSEPLPAVAGPLLPLEEGVLAGSSDDGVLDGSGALYDGSGALYVGSGALWPLEPVLLECSPPVEPADF